MKKTTPSAFICKILIILRSRAPKTPSQQNRVND